MSPEKEREYEILEAYLDAFATYIWKIDPAEAYHPTNAGKKIVEQYGKSKALEGLRQAVNDTVQELTGRSPAYLARVDEILSSCGVLTFSEIYRRHTTKYKKILKCSKLKTETEYYLAKGMLDDLDSIASPEERATLAKLIADYEQRA